MLAQLLCSFYAMLLIGPIFCLTSGVAQSHVLSRYTGGLVRFTWWEWALYTTAFGSCGWFVGMSLSFTIGRDLFAGSFDFLSVSLASQVVLLFWGTLTGLMLGFGQALILRWKTRAIFGPHFFASTAKAGALWTAVSATSWAVGLGLGGLMFVVTTPVFVKTTPGDDLFPELTPEVFAMQIISLVVFSVPISTATGATLAWLLRHSVTGASHNPNFISHKVN
ncbi:MAG TPA: hypothetical protein VF952_09465 [Chloroflexia bacterium]